MKLYDIATIYLGITKSRYVTLKPNSDSIERYYITNKDINNEFNINELHKYYFKNNIPNQYLIKKYDILFSLYPSYSSLIILDNSIINSVAQQNLSIIRIKEEYVSSNDDMENKWLYGYVLFALQKQKKFLINCTVGSSIAFLKLDFLKNLDFPDDLFVNEKYKKIGEVFFLKELLQYNNNKKIEIIGKLLNSLGDDYE